MLRAVVAALTLAMMAPAAARAVEIEYWQYFFQTRVTAMDQLIEQFQAANPGIKVKHTTFPYADYQAKVAAAVPAGEGPDVVQLFYGWLDNFVRAKLIQPLPRDAFPAQAIEADFPTMVAAMKRGDDYYALPTAVRSLALFYNKKLFQQAGLDPDKPPATLDELVQMAQKLTVRDAGGNYTQLGFATDVSGQDLPWWREVLVRQFGGNPYLDDYRRVNYGDAAGAKALQWYVDLQVKHHVTQAGFLENNQAAFKSGRAAMTVDGSFAVGAYSSTRGLSFGIAELPVGPDGAKSNYASYWVNGITTKASGEKLDAAKKFMAFVTSPAAMQLWLKVVGELPARRSVAADRANATDPIYGPFIRGLDYAHATRFADEAAQRQVGIDMVNRVLLQGQPAIDSVTEAAKAEQPIIDRYR